MRIAPIEPQPFARIAADCVAAGAIAAACGLLGMNAPLLGTEGQMVPIDVARFVATAAAAGLLVAPLVRATARRPMRLRTLVLIGALMGAGWASAAAAVMNLASPWRMDLHCIAAFAAAGALLTAFELPICAATATLRGARARLVWHLLLGLFTAGLAGAAASAQLWTLR